MRTLIIGPSWVGDMMMSHSLYRTLKQSDPDLILDVMAPAWCRGLLTKMPEVNNIIEMPLSHGQLALSKRYRLGQNLRNNHYDNALVLPNSFKSALIPFFSRIPTRTGWLGEMRYGILNDYRRLDKDAFPLMVQRYVALAFSAGCMRSAADIPAPLLRPKLQVNGVERQNTLVAFGLQPSKLIAFCPGAEFGPSKRWPSYHYAALGKALADQGKHIVILGSKQDRSIGEDIVAQMGCPDAITNLAGQTTLEEAINVLAATIAVVTNDSGLMHIAAALERPTLALYGPSSPDFTPPLSESAQVIRLINGFSKVRKGTAAGGYHSSLIDIKPDLVLAKLMRLFNHNRMQ